MKYMDRILEESKNLAYNYFKSFCIKLNLNSDVFSHIYSVKIKYGKIYDKKAVAEYDPYSNEIFISYKYFLNLDEDDLKRELTIAILHELIHAKRKNFIKKSLISTRINLAINSEDQNTICDYSMDTKKYYSNNKKLQIENLRKLKGQYAFEEIMTETLAIIMYASKNQTNIDLDKLTKKIYHSTSTQDLGGATFIREMGFKFIEWFMISSNYDLMEITFKEKYPELLNCFINLYTDKNPTTKEFENISLMCEILREKRKTKCL